MVDKIIDAKVLLLKDVAWGMQHLPYGYQIVANETTYKYLKSILRHEFRVVIDNSLSDYVVKFEETKNA